MYYLSRAIVFIACLIAACRVNWWIGLAALALAALFIQKPKGGLHG